MDAIAMHSKSSSTSSSLFDSPNENKTIAHRCLMAREVISKSINPKPSSSTTNPSQEELDNECEDEDGASCSTNKFQEDVALLVKKYSGTMGTKGSNFKGKTFGRRKCYNCDSPKHFVADCPYQRREDKL